MLEKKNLLGALGDSSRGSVFHHDDSGLRAAGCYWDVNRRELSSCFRNLYNGFKLCSQFV
jgi:hypothetical protein